MCRFSPGLASGKGANSDKNLARMSSQQMQNISSEILSLWLGVDITKSLPLNLHVLESYARVKMLSFAPTYFLVAVMHSVSARFGGKARDHSERYGFVVAECTF